MRRAKPRGKEEGRMKQIIILFSTVILGIAIGGFVISLEGSAQNMTDQIKTEMTTMVTKERS